MVIYKTTNIINGKIYIGQDSNNNPKYIGSGKILKKAIKNYGKENFKKEIIEYCTSITDLNEKEIYWIKFYNSTDKNIGYNIAHGGYINLHKIGSTHSDEVKNKMKDSWAKRKLDPEFVHNMTGFKHSAETKQKYSDDRIGKLTGEKNGMYGKQHTDEAKEKMKNPKFGSDNGMYGKQHTDEAKKKISEAVTGEKNGFYGKKHTEETRLKLIEAAKNRPNFINRKQVNAEGIIFTSQKEASEYFDISLSTVSYRCKSDNFNWFYI